MRFLSASFGIALLLGACVGDDPAPSGVTAADAGSIADAGPSDASSEAAASKLPLIDRWDYTTAPFATAADACTSSTTQALSQMGGTYVDLPMAEANARGVARPGAALFTYCASAGSTSLLMTAALGLEGALDAQNDNARLFALVDSSGSAPRPVSAAAPSLAALRIADGAALPAAGVTQILCRDRAKVAIDTVFADVAERWSTTGGSFVAIGGGPGTTIAITCLAADLRAVVFHVATIDPAVEPAARLDAVRGELRRLGGI